MYKRQRQPQKVRETERETKRETATETEWKPFHGTIGLIDSSKSFHMSFEYIYIHLQGICPGDKYRICCLVIVY